MAYRRRRVVVRSEGKRSVRTGRKKSPKTPHRLVAGSGPSIFNLHWLFGLRRHRRKV